jgi:hypothetical protein
MTTHRITRTAALALALAAMSAPAAPAQDLRMPDTRDGSPAEPVVVTQDLRNADQRDVTPPQDLRGADAAGAPTDGSAIVVVRAPEAVPASGIEWGDVGLGAGGLLGVTLIGLGGTLLVLHRRHTSLARR